MAAAPVVFPVLLVLPGAMRRCGCCISLYIWTPPSVTPPAIMVSSVMRQGTNYSHQAGDGAMGPALVMGYHHDHINTISAQASVLSCIAQRGYCM